MPTYTLRINLRPDNRGQLVFWLERTNGENFTGHVVQYLTATRVETRTEYANGYGFSNLPFAVIVREVSRWACDGDARSARFVTLTDDPTIGPAITFSIKRHAENSATV